MTRKEIKNRVIEIVSNKICIDQNEICESTRFREDLGTDSLDDVELLMEFELVFGIKIPDEEMFKIVKVGDVIDGLCQRLGVTNTIKTIDRNVPDKIYTTESHHGWYETNEGGDKIEYLRKDALLEKIDDAIAHLSDGSITGYYEILVYKDIRELIESM